MISLIHYYPDSFFPLKSLYFDKYAYYLRIVRKH